MRWLRIGASVLLVAMCGLAVASAGGAHPRGAPHLIAIAKLKGSTTAWLQLLEPSGQLVRAFSRRQGRIDDDPAWSPDGRSIAFTRTTDGYRSFHVFVVPAAGGKARRLTAGRYDERPAWSPDGRWIAYQSAEGIQLIQPDGSGRRGVPGTDRGAWPTWAPDSDHLAYSKGGYLWTVRIDGSDRHRLMKGLEPAWSPDGNLIAFSPAGGGVATVRASGGGRRILGKGLQPSWSPNGNRLAFTRLPPGEGFSVWTMRADGSGRKRLAGAARSPAWMP